MKTNVLRFMYGTGLTFVVKVLCCLFSYTLTASEAKDNRSEQHTPWSLRPLTKPALPSKANNPIDAFIRSNLTDRQLSHSAPAKPRSLLRRLTYDLTGLPPTPEAVDAFESNSTPKAYETQVDQLLASTQHGEHFARHWLDVANYADTHGNDHDYQRPNAWPYRDYVIHAFNNDKPYARFVKEQVAGDALYPEDPWATVALGFVAAGPWDHTLMVTVRADTIDHRIAQNLDRDNMVSKVMGTFQSLTVHCARCHDHKFDPVTLREYYSLQSVFAGVDRADRPYDLDPDTHLKRQVLLKEKRALEKPGTTVIEQLTKPETIQAVATWETERQGQEAAWKRLDIVSVLSTGGATLTRQSDGSWFASGVRPDRDSYQITARWPGETLRGIRLEVMPDPRLPQNGPGRWDNGNFHLSELRAWAMPPDSSEGARPIEFARAMADYNEGPTISAEQTIDGNDATHWGIHPRYGETHEAVFEVRDPRHFPDGTLITLSLENKAGAPGHGIGRFRLLATDSDKAASILSPVSPEIDAILKLPRDKRSQEQRHTLALAVLKRKNTRALESLPPPQQVYAITHDFPADGPNFTPPDGPRPIHVLARGELSKPGELIGPGTLSCIPNLTSDLAIEHPENESQRRAALARWLADPHNVLTWRSIVNRVWAWHFGRGLCDTPNDFGALGGQPSHPELLDWLAVWFRDEAKGSLKALHRLIVTSETWKQTSMSNQGTAMDPENRLLWRGNRHRLSGEEVRDTLLTLSGKLDHTQGGPPAVQFNTKGDATFMSGGNPPYLDYAGFDPDAPAARRRAIYRFVFRTVTDPFMAALDCPDGSTPSPTRNESTTPQQALAMLNDPFAIRQCEHIATRFSNESNTTRDQIQSAFRHILLRYPSASEIESFAAYAEEHGLANTCQLLLNSNTFLYLD